MDPSLHAILDHPHISVPWSGPTASLTNRVLLIQQLGWEVERKHLAWKATRKLPACSLVRSSLPLPLNNHLDMSCSRCNPGVIPCFVLDARTLMDYQLAHFLSGSRSKRPTTVTASFMANGTKKARCARLRPKKVMRRSPADNFR